MVLYPWTKAYLWWGTPPLGVGGPQNRDFGYFS